MKLLLSFTFAFCLIFFVQAQEKIEFEACLENCIKPLKLISSESGKYSVKVINANDRVMSMPLFNKSYNRASEMEFEINIKMWKPGNYIVVVECNKEVTAVQKMKITNFTERRNAWLF